MKLVRPKRKCKKVAHLKATSSQQQRTGRSTPHQTEVSHQLGWTSLSTLTHKVVWASHLQKSLRGVPLQKRVKREMLVALLHRCLQPLIGQTQAYTGKNLPCTAEKMARLTRLVWRMAEWWLSKWW